MAKLTCFLISTLLAVSCVLAQVNIDPQPPITTTTPAPGNKTTEVPPTTSSTMKPTTTSSTTAKPTTPEPTTSTSTTTTTPPPTTSTPKPTPPPTTPQPTTSTLAPSTTTEAPIPTPPPSTGSWNVTDKNQTTCILVKMAGQAKVTYHKTINETATLLMNVPVNGTQVTGDCGSDKQMIEIGWGNNSLKLQFSKEKSEFVLSDVVLKIVFNGTTITGAYDKPEFNTSLKMSYKCDRNEVVNLTIPTTNVTVAELTLSNLQLEAFRSGNSTEFGPAQDCWTPTADIVPIVVGSALAILVVIVLVAYLVGRRRATARGYLSM